jgi:hypothetical protein
MKKWIQFVLVFMLLFPQSVWAGTYRETRPEAAQAIQAQGIGAT